MNSLLYTYDPTIAGSFKISFKRCSREPKSWKEELYAAALEIVNESTKPLWLCFSGGIDSEVLCEAFFNQGINFSVLTLEHVGGTNEHDIGFARKWCRAHGVTQKIVQIDMDKFLKEDIERYITDGYVAFHPFRYQQIKLLEIAESLGGRAILGGGEHLYEVKKGLKQLSPEDIYHQYLSEFITPLEWNARNGTKHRPYFYLQTPELMLSYLNLPFIECALTHPETFRHPASKYLLKRLAFQAEWPENEARAKYDGFEKIRSDIHAKRDDMQLRFGDMAQSFDLPIMKLKRDISPK
jgi:hypothetical protein